MDGDLFSKPAEYTIDSSCLVAMFDDSPWTSKQINAGLWVRVLELINKGIIISHVEVLLEIKKDGRKGEELYNWVQSNKEIFRDYNEDAEGKIIRSMSEKYKAFVNAKLVHEHADPWLVAQAKHRGLKIISEELFTTSPKPSRWGIPNVCRDPLFNIECINLWGLVKERNWKFE